MVIKTSRNPVIWWARPQKFLTIIDVFFPWILALTLLLWGAGLWSSLVISPPDYQQGEAVRIMYIHVPSAWLSLAIYSFMAVGSFVFLIWRQPLGALMAEAAVPLGMCFSFLSLATGALWGKPMWGAWWVWDARLTSALVLFFLYLGYMVLRHSFDHPLQHQQPAAYLALVGWLNIPIIKGSVIWWHTLHQGPSLLRAKGTSLHPDILVPLLLMMAAFTGTFLILLSLNFKVIYLRYKISALQIKLSRRS